jgi:DNA polymerase (family 10)
MMDRFEIARALREIGALLELEGENPFKIRAYDTGARALEGLTQDLGALVAEGRLTEIAGIGEALAGKIVSLHTTGRSDTLDKLRARHPPGILGLLQIPDLGPKKIVALHAALGVASLEELEAACRDGRVAAVKGFGEKTQAKLLEGIERLKTRGAERRMLLLDALALGEPLVAHLRTTPAAVAVALAGSARRGKETVGDLDVVAASRDPAAMADALAAYPGTAEVLARGETKTTARLAGGVQVDLRVVPPEDYATLLHHMTGSKAHNTRLRGIARTQGYTLSEWGLHRLAAAGAPMEGPLEPAAAPAPDAPATADPARAWPPEAGEKVRVESEEALYAALGLAYVPPELREDAGELEAARDAALPADLVRLEDVRGMVHCHTTWSDGRNSLEEMARAADALGMEYLTITDHSRSAGYAGGLTVDRLRAQWEEIDRVQERVKVRLLKGTEADILEDGALDWPDAVLEELEVVVASVHSRFKMDEDQMTRRLTRAMSLPFFKIWGHGVGRLLLERDAYPVRVEEVLDALAASRGAVEVNGDPRRLDLEPRHLRAARARGIPVVLSVDAHSVQALGFLRLAVTTARRGWVRRGEVLNARGAAEFAAAVRPAG